MENEISIEEMTIQDGEQLMYEYYMCFVPVTHVDLN